MVRWSDSRFRRPARGRTDGASLSAIPLAIDRRAHGCERVWFACSKWPWNYGFGVWISSNRISLWSYRGPADRVGKLNLMLLWTSMSNLFKVARALALAHATALRHLL